MFKDIFIHTKHNNGYAMNLISDKWQFIRQPVLTKVSSLLSSLGYSTCFSWNPHTLAVNSLDSFLGVANRESRPLRWRGFLHLVPTVLWIDAFCTNSGCVTEVVPDKNWRNFFFILLKLNVKVISIHTAYMLMDMPWTQFQINVFFVLNCLLQVNFTDLHALHF